MRENELQHYGVPGMKWGHRKAQSSKPGSSRPSGISALSKVRTKINNAHNTRKAINREYKPIKSQDKKWYGNNYSDAVYTKAAKNVVKKGMDRNTALKKAKTSTRVNTGMLVGTYALATIGSMNADKIQKYVNERSIQKANASLARIGTYTYEQVAGNVYNKVMK